MKKTDSTGIVGLPVYIASIILAILSASLAPVLFPTVVSFDGYTYLNQAEILFTDRFYREWDFLRTPGYQALLKLIMLVFGDSTPALSYVSQFLSLCGVCLLGDLVRRRWGLISAALAICMLTIFPTRIAYAQCILTESASFFCLSLILWTIFWSFKSLTARVSSTILVIIIGYYFRPSVLYLSPFVIPASLLIHLSDNRALSLRRATISCLISFAVIFCAVSPWQQMVKKSGRTEAITRWSVIKQGLVPAESISSETVRQRYTQQLAIAFNNADVALDGIPNTEADLVLNHLGSNSQSLNLKDAYLKLPLRTLSAAFRTFLVMLQVGIRNSENEIFRKAVLSPKVGQSPMMLGPTKLDGPLRARFDVPARPNSVGAALQKLAPLYNWLITFGGFTAIVMTIYGCCSRQWHLSVLAAFPLAWFAFHAVLLMSIDRYSYPAQGFIIINIVTLISEIGRRRLGQNRTEQC